MHFVDSEVSEERRATIEAHLQDCPSCQQLVHMLQDEIISIQTALTLPALPDSFEQDILRHLKLVPVAQATSPSLPPRSSRKQKWADWRRVALASIATLLIVLVVGTSVSPTFASYVSSFLTRLGGDWGLKKAAEQGFSTSVNTSVTDQGITLKVKDVLADPTRLVVTYVLLDEQGNVLPDLYFETFSPNKVYVSNEQGEIISERPRFQLGDQYADLTFSLRNPPNNMTVHLEIQQYGSREGKPIQWSLKVPVDIEKSMAASKTVPIQQDYTTPQGLSFHAKQVTYAPSATRIELETNWTQEARERIQKQARERLQTDLSEELLRDLYFHQISYHIENEQGEIYADMVPGPGNQTRTVSLAEYAIEGDQEKRGWYGSFVPTEQDERLFLVLDQIYVNEAADISLTFHPGQLAEQPFSQQIKDNTYTISPLSQETVKETGEKVWSMMLEIKGSMNAWPKWILRDDKGNSYPVAIDYQRSPIEGSSTGGSQVKETLLIKNMDHLPAQLTLIMQTQKKTYSDFQWRVEIPPAPQ